MWPFSKWKKRSYREMVGIQPGWKQEVGSELVKWRNFGVCPECGSTDEWLEGPSGGSCTNFKCDNCGSKFNVAMPPLNMIQRIG